MGTGLNNLGVSMTPGFPWGPQLWRQVCRGHTCPADCDSSCSECLEGRQGQSWGLTLLWPCLKRRVEEEAGTCPEGNLLHHLRLSRVGRS